jgi:hypothetical protein
VNPSTSEKETMLKALRLALLALRHTFGSEATPRRRRVAVVLALTAAATIAAGYSALAGQGPSQWCSDNGNNSEIHVLNSPITFNLEPGSSFGNPNYFMTCYSTTAYESGDTAVSGQAFVVNTPTTSGTSATCASDPGALVRVDCFAGVGVNTSNPTSPSAGYTLGTTTLTVAGTPASAPGHSVGAGVDCVGGTVAISATSCAWGGLAGISGLGSSGGRIAVGGSGCAWGWYLSVNTQGCSEAAVLGISGTGPTNSYGWESTIPYGVAFSGTNNAYGSTAAVSGTGCASGVIAVSLTGCANGSWWAVSGLGSAYSPGWSSDLSPVCTVCQIYMDGHAVGGGSATGGIYAISAGNANAYGTAISATGNASGMDGYPSGSAISGTGNSWGSLVGISGTGSASATGGYFGFAPETLVGAAISGIGTANGRTLAVSGTGSANGDLVSVSGTNNASGGSVLRVSGGEKDVSLNGNDILDGGNPGNPPPPPSIDDWNGYRECPILNNSQESRYILLTKMHNGWVDFVENGQVRGSLEAHFIATLIVAAARSNQEPYCTTIFSSSFTYTDAVTNVTREIPYGSFTSDGVASARLDYVSADFEIHLTWAGGIPSLFPGPYFDSNHLDCNHWADNPSTEVFVRADNAAVAGAVRGAGGNPLSAKPLQGTGWQSSGQELMTCM